MGLFRSKRKPDFSAAQEAYYLQVEEGALKLWSGDSYFRSSLFRKGGEEEYFEAIRDDAYWRLQRKITYKDSGTTSVKAGKAKLKYFEALHEMALYEATQFSITGNADVEKVEEDLAGAYFKDVAHKLNVIFNCEGLPRMTRNGYAVGQDDFPVEELALLETLRKAEEAERENRRLEAEKKQQEAQAEEDRRNREAEEERRRRESLPVVISWGDGVDLIRIFNHQAEDVKADPAFFASLLDVRGQINALNDYLKKFENACLNQNWDDKSARASWLEKAFLLNLQRLKESCERQEGKGEAGVLLGQIYLVTQYFYTSMLAQLARDEESGTGLEWNGSSYKWMDTSGRNGHFFVQNLFQKAYSDLEKIAAERFQDDMRQQHMLLLSVMEVKDRAAFQKTLQEITGHLDKLKKTIDDYMTLGIRRGLEGLEPPPLLVEGVQPPKPALPGNDI